MKNRCGGAIFYFCAFLLLLCPLSYAQIPGQPPVETQEEIPVEPVKPVIDVDVKDGLLSVELFDAEFGNALRAISEKAKFKIEISSSVANKKISTNFKDVDIERGIRRLFAIIKEKDYVVSYNSAGNIDKIEVYGSSGHAKQPTTHIEKRPSVPRKKVPPLTPPSQVSPPPGQIHQMPPGQMPQAPLTPPGQMPQMPPGQIIPQIPVPPPDHH